MARKRLPKTRYRSPKGRAETGAPLPLNKLLLGAKQVPIRKELPWHTTPHSECDIDPEAVSVDSEAHDMENGRDGLDGNAPEKDAPEKDDRDAQPPVDTDNR